VVVIMLLMYTKY